MTRILARQQQQKRFLISNVIASRPRTQGAENFRSNLCRIDSFSFYNVLCLNTIPSCARVLFRILPLFARWLTGRKGVLKPDDLPLSQSFKPTEESTSTDARKAGRHCSAVSRGSHWRPRPFEREISLATLVRCLRC
jgi:hypothetical protein